MGGDPGHISNSVFASLLLFTRKGVMVCDAAIPDEELWEVRRAGDQTQPGVIYDKTGHSSNQITQITRSDQ